MSAYKKWLHVPKRYRRFHLAENEHAILAEGFKNFDQPRRKSAKVVNGDIFDELLVIDKSPEKLPVHWCFNTWAEPIAFFRALPDQFYLVAMHSTNTMTERWHYKRKFQEYVVDSYIDSIINLGNINNKMIIGGNCQGAPIAESIAIRIHEKYGFLPLLVTLEYVPRRHYPGPRLFVFGTLSDFNPFNTKKHFCMHLKKLNHSNYAWSFLKAGHGQYMTTDEVHNLTKYIEQAYEVYSSSGTLGEGLFESDINLFDNDDARQLFMSKFSRPDINSPNNNLSLFPPIEDIFREVYQAKESENYIQMRLLLVEIKKRLKDCADCELYEHFMSTESTTFEAVKP